MSYYPTLFIFLNKDVSELSLVVCKDDIGKREEGSRSKPFNNYEKVAVNYCNLLSLFRSINVTRDAHSYKSLPSQWSFLGAFSGANNPSFLFHRVNCGK